MTSIMQYMKSHDLIWRLGTSNIRQGLRKTRLEWLKNQGVATAREAGLAWGVGENAARIYLRGLVRGGLVECTSHVSVGWFGSLPIRYWVRQPERGVE